MTPSDPETLALPVTTGANSFQGASDTGQMKPLAALPAARSTTEATS